MSVVKKLTILEKSLYWSAIIICSISIIFIPLSFLIYQGLKENNLDYSDEVLAYTRWWYWSGKGGHRWHDFKRGQCQYEKWYNNR